MAKKQKKEKVDLDKILSKPPQKLYKVGELVRYTGLTRQTIHQYTQLGLIKEAERTPSGHRLYSESVFETLRKIILYKRHRPLAEVKKMLELERKKEGKN